ncbi:MAG: hypothetical protein EAZ92_14535 [Candidatus Kapaibacterium sp.]|nr:MAG: hypothetical protein EAZ92_14535 [Candidatus Kapabacteria bacterium]
MERPRILTEIKAQTRPQHDSIEQNRFTKGMMDGSMTLLDYKLYLQKFYSVHKAVEQAFEQFSWQEYRLNLQERSKLHLIAADLQTLGMSAAEIENLPAMQPVPQFHSIAEAFGAMYVLEGSTLGGQIQARQLERVLASAGADAPQAIAYFSSYGARVGAMWKDFCVALTIAANNDEAVEQRIIEAAQRTFAAIEAWLVAEEELALA